MVSILPSDRSGMDILGRYLGEAISKGLPAFHQNRQQQMSREAISNQLGPEIASLPPDLQKIYLQDKLKNQRQAQLQDYLSNIYSGGSGKESQQEMPPGQTDTQPNKSQENPKQFDAASIPDELIAQAAAMNPTAGRILQQQKDVALREKRMQEELDLKKLKASPEYKREQQVQGSQAQADVKYNQQLQESSKQHALKEQTLDRLEQLNKKGVTGKPYEKLLEKVGLVNLTSEGRREFAADVKNLITDIRSILGGQFSNFEFQTILNAYPSADFSQDANEAIIKNLKGFQDIKSKEVVFANQLKKENGGKLPIDFQSKVNDMVHEYAQSKIPEIKENSRVIMNAEYGIPEGHTLMFDPKGEPLSVSNDEIDRYKQLGAYLP